VGLLRQSPLFNDFSPFLRFFGPFSDPPKTTFLDPPPEFPDPPKNRTPRNPEIPEKSRNLEKGPKNTPAKTTYDENVNLLSATPFLDEKRHPLKLLTMKKVGF